MEEKASTSNVILIRPHNFGFNEQTANTNKFQKKTSSLVNLHALKEFNNAAETLRLNDINVFIFDDLVGVDTPDSVFPNNWVSFHSDGTTVVYPMLAMNRRKERRPDIIQSLSTIYGFYCSKVIDLTFYEDKNKFLEGTGSLVLDRINKITYSCLSERTNEDLVNKFCKELGYAPIKFHAYDSTGFSFDKNGHIFNNSLENGTGRFTLESGTYLIKTYKNGSVVYNKNYTLPQEKVSVISIK